MPFWRTGFGGQSLISGLVAISVSLVKGRKSPFGKYVDGGDIQFTPEIASNWNRVIVKCSEARRFQNDFLGTLSELSGSNESGL